MKTFAEIAATQQQVLTFSVPWPPSDNDRKIPIIVRGKPMAVHPPEVLQYKESLYWILCAQGIRVSEPITALVKLNLAMYPQNNRVDIQNGLKVFADALQYAKVLKNDRQIIDIHLWKAGTDPQGRIDVRLEPLTGGR